VADDKRDMPVETGRGQKARAPGRQQKGGAKRGCGNFLRHEIYKNSVSFVEAEMGMEGQIMCMEKCSF